MVAKRNKAEPRKRTRLSPEARREQILDAAKKSIVSNGLQQFSLKKLAVDAGVSEPLLFHYFSSGKELLKQLLERDFSRSIGSLNASLDEAESLDEILHIYVTRNYDDFEKDSVIDILLAEPDIASAIEEQRALNARRREQFLIGTMSKELGVRRRKAAMIALMASATSMAAARFAHDRDISRDESIQTVIDFVKAGFESQRNNAAQGGRHD